MQVVAGGVAALGVQAVAERVDTVAENWYMPAVVIGGVGFLLRKRAKWAQLSPALLGAAGFSLVQNYQIAKAAEAAAGETSGLMPEYGYDTTAVLDPSESELLTSNRLTAAGAPNVAASAGEAATIGSFG